MVRHPATYWAKFYLSRRTHSYEQIEGLLTCYNLPGFSVDDLQELDASMQYPRVFRPQLRNDRTSQRFIRQEQIFEAWHPCADMKAAIAILDDHTLRQHIETLILSPVRPEQAVRKLAERLKVNLTVRSYEFFRHYFWNPRLLTSTEWGRFIRERESTNQEWLQLANSTDGPEGVKLLLWKTGLGGISKIDSNQGFARAKAVAFLMLEQLYMDAPSPAHSKMFLSYLQAAKMAQEGEDESANAVQDIVQAFKSFKLRTQIVKTKTVKQLTEGNFSPPEIVNDDDEGMVY